MVSQSRLSEILLEETRHAGFPLGGLIDFALAGPEFQKHLTHYDRWLQHGHQAGMQYLVRGRDRRADPSLLLPGARSLLSVAIPYDPRPLGAESLTEGPRYARYLGGNDYHRALATRLEEALSRAAQRWTGEGGDPFSWKVCVDTSAVLERSWAALAGLGWIGKNTLLIHPQYGSYLFLAEALLTAETGQGPKILPDYCGNCSRCLNACPTQAFPEPHTLDARRCISGLTLEHRGPFPETAPSPSAVGGWIAGCDRCQEVCPFNQKAVQRAGQYAEASRGSHLLFSWDALLDETVEEYSIRARKSALSRVKAPDFDRNLAHALESTLKTLPREQGLALQERLGSRIQGRADRATDSSEQSRWKSLLPEAVTTSLRTESHTNGPADDPHGEIES